VTRDPLPSQQSAAILLRNFRHIFIVHIQCLTLECTVTVFVEQNSIFLSPLLIAAFIVLLCRLIIYYFLFKNMECRDNLKSGIFHVLFKKHGIFQICDCRDIVATFND